MDAGTTWFTGHSLRNRQSRSCVVHDHPVDDHQKFVVYLDLTSCDLSPDRDTGIYPPWDVLYLRHGPLKYTWDSAQKSKVYKSRPPIGYSRIVYFTGSICPNPNTNPNTIIKSVKYTMWNNK